METHAHHLHHAPGKKIWHYFYEFVMLFLAVFCGFLAENVREHQVERQREKQFAKHLLTDLRADSNFFARRIEQMGIVLKKHQTFYQLMTASRKPTNKQILNDCLPLLYTFDLLANTTTYNQMKTSGSLRYIRNDGLTNALQKYYDVFLTRAIHGSELEIEYYTNTINPFVLKHFRVQDFDFIGDTARTTDPVILDRTSQTDQELLNIIEGYAGFHKVNLERLELPLRTKLDELIGLLKKEYHLQ